MKLTMRTISDESRELRSYPELALLDDPRQRFGLWRAAHRDAVSGLGMLYVVGFILAGGFCALFTATAPRLPLIGSWIAANSWIRGVLAGACVPIPLSFFVRFRRRRFEQSLRTRLNRLGVIVCIGCGYDLRGQTTPRCPECGQVFGRGLRRGDDGELNRPDTTEK